MKFDSFDGAPNCLFSTTTMFGCDWWIVWLNLYRVSTKEMEKEMWKLMVNGKRENKI